MNQAHLPQVWRKQHPPFVHASAVQRVGRGASYCEEGLVVGDYSKYCAIEVPLKLKDRPDHGSHLKFQYGVIFLI